MLNQVNCIFKLLIGRANNDKLRGVRVFSEVIWQHFDHQIVADQERRIPVVCFAVFHLALLRVKSKCPRSSWWFCCCCSCNCSLLILSFCVCLSWLLRIECHIIVNFLFKCVPAILIESLAVKAKEYHYFSQGFILNTFGDVIEKENEYAVHFCCFNLLLLINILHNVISRIILKLFDSI